MASAAEKTPRVIPQLERAPDGFRRVKVRCDNYGKEPLYLLLRDAEKNEDAFAVYAKETGLAAELDGLKGRGIEAPAPQFIVRELAD
jgi:hypothetical protein